MVGPAAHVLGRLFASRAFRALLTRLGPAAAAKAVELARQGRWRRLAVLHAETAERGTITRGHLDDGAAHWVVWEGDHPVAAYPPFEGDLAVAARGHDPASRVAPEDLPTRQVGRSVTQGAQGTGRRLGSGFARARRLAGQGARRASEEGARAAGRTVGRRRGADVKPEDPPRGDGS